MKSLPNTKNTGNQHKTKKNTKPHQIQEIMQKKTKTQENKKNTMSAKHVKTQQN